MSINSHLWYVSDEIGWQNVGDVMTEESDSRNRFDPSDQ